MESFSPISRRHLSLKEERSDGIIDCPNHALRHAVLLRGARTGKSKRDTLLSKVFLEVDVVVFPSIIALKAFDVSIELPFDKGGEV